MSHRRLRIAAVLAAGLCGPAAREIVQLGQARDGLSPLGWAALSGVLAAGAALFILAVGPRAWWDRFALALAPVRGRLADAPPQDDARTGTALILLGCITYLLMLARYLPLQQGPWDDDQGAYLETAGEIHARGGVRGLIRDLLAGDFTEANRHPLYLALLSLRPTFESGKRLSAAIGSVALILMTVLIARRRGRMTAGVFCVLLATNAAFATYTTRVVCEGLVVLLSGWAWLLSVPRVSHLPPQPDSQPRESMEVPSLARRAGVNALLQHAGIGALLGLAYLAKATGLVLFGGYLAWLALPCWRTPSGDGTASGANPTVRSRRFLMGLCATITFLAASSPLLIRNVVRFGQPFHNVNSLLLFADRYEQFDQFLASGVTTGEAARRYIASHSIGDVLVREASGIVWEAFIILRSLGPAPLDDSRVLFGLPLALLAAATAVVDRGPQYAWLAVWALLLWLVFAWYVPIAAGERFILPLLVPLLATAADGAVRLLSAARGSVGRRWLMAAATLWCVAWVTLAYCSQSLAAQLIGPAEGIVE